MMAAIVVVVDRSVVVVVVVVVRRRRRSVAVGIVAIVVRIVGRIDSLISTVGPGVVVVAVVIFRGTIPRRCCRRRGRNVGGGIHSRRRCSRMLIG